MNAALLSDARVSNADRWSELCDRQIQILQSLKQRFPERAEQLSHISSHWLEIRQSLKQTGKAPAKDRRQSGQI